MILYEEKQVVKRNLKYIMVLATIVFLSLYILVDRIFLAGFITFFIMTLLTLSLKLDIKLYSDAIEYRLYPLKASYKKILFKDLETIDLVSLKHKGFYYGFKIKKNIFATMYLLGGYDAIKIVKKNQKPLFLSTQNKEHLKKILNEITK